LPGGFRVKVIADGTAIDWLGGTQRERIDLVVYLHEKNRPVGKNPG
jgi:hypothetical protein